jgi:hypothetical protein
VLVLLSKEASREDMMTTLEQVLSLLPQLSPSERARVQELLESDRHDAAQRAANHAALVHLDARIATDDDEDDSWWEDFTQGLDRDRLSNRPLYTEQSSSSA